MVHGKEYPALSHTHTHHLGGYLGWSLPNDEAFRRKIPTYQMQEGVERKGRDT